MLYEINLKMLPEGVGWNLSFCLWEGPTALDLFAFTYVTILYSLILVVVTVFLLRKCNCTFCGKFYVSRSSTHVPEVN